MDIKSLGSMALVFVVAVVVIAIGAQINDSVAQTTCTSYGYTYITNTTRAAGNLLVNPITSATYGCCVTVSPAGSNNCTSWPSQAAINTSAFGNVSMATFSGWLPLLALVVIAAIVIGVILNNFARSAGV